MSTVETTSPAVVSPALRAAEDARQRAKVAANDGEHAATSAALEHGDASLEYVNEVAAGKPEGKERNDALLGALNALADDWNCGRLQASKRSDILKRIRMASVSGSVPLEHLPLWHADKLASACCKWNKADVTVDIDHKRAQSARLLALRFKKDAIDRDGWTAAITVELIGKITDVPAGDALLEAARLKLADPSTSEEVQAYLLDEWPQLRDDYVNRPAIMGIVANIRPKLAEMTPATRDEFTEVLVKLLEDLAGDDE
jgi:hypothetical protein